MKVVSASVEKKVSVAKKRHKRALLAVRVSVEIAPHRERFHVDFDVLLRLLRGVLPIEYSISGSEVALEMLDEEGHEHPAVVIDEQNGFEVRIFLENVAHRLNLVCEDRETSWNWEAEGSILAGDVAPNHRAVDGGGTLPPRVIIALSNGHGYSIKPIKDRAVRKKMIDLGNRIADAMRQ